MLVNFGSYNLVFNNCQHFCNKLLKEFELPGHTTGTTKVAIGAGVAAGALAAYGLYKYFSSDDEKEKKKKKYIVPQLYSYIVQLYGLI